MRLRPRSAALGAAAVALAALALLAASGSLIGSATAAVGVHRLGVAPALPRGSHRLGRVDARTRLSVDIALSPRSPTALSAYAQAVSTPGNADYRRYLTLAQFRRRFAPTAGQIASVDRTLEAAGLTPSRVSTNGLLIGVRARAGQLSRAFHTSLARVRLADGAIGYSNIRAPEVNAGIAGIVQGVVGLSDLDVPHALGLVRPKGTGHGRANARRAAETATVTSAPVPCAAATSAAAGAYTSDEIASAYGFTSLYGNGDFGAGQTVALMEFEPYSTSDIQAYEACYGIDGGTASDVTNTLVDGGVGSSYTGPAAGSGEADLDIDQIVSLAPAASVDVFEAPSTDAGDLDAYSDMVADKSVNVISTSWGECEYVNGSSTAEAEKTIFAEAATAGISVYAAAGDAGSTDCYGEGVSRNQEDSLAVDDPGSDPYVTSVGGTSLPSASDAAAQTTWNDSSIQNGAGGGGISLQWTMPSYQSGASAALDVVSPNSSSSVCAANTDDAGADCREVPDVSADADPQTGYVIYSDGAWQVTGGTSAAAPLWAALTALANASSGCSGTTIGFANPVLYGVADNATDYANDFTDITSGNNAYTPSGYSGDLYAAGSGYDLASGLGTPKAATLVPDMCTYAGANSSTGSTTTTSPSTPTPVPSTTTPSRTTPAPSTTTPANGSSTGTKLDCAFTAPLRSAASSLALSASRHSVKLLIPFNLPGGCGSYRLSLQRHIATTERRGAKAVDTLKIQLLSSSGTVISTLSTLSNRNAEGGYQTLAFNLTRYRGRRLTLRLTATRSGAKSTTFTLRALKVALS